jgi:hypothetical protein
LDAWSTQWCSPNRRLNSSVDDSETVDAIAPRMDGWNNITLLLRGESVDIVGFAAIGRLDLLSILQQAA